MNDENKNLFALRDAIYHISEARERRAAEREANKDKKLNKKSNK